MLKGDAAYATIDDRRMSRAQAVREQPFHHEALSPRAYVWLKDVPDLTEPERLQVLFMARKIMEGGAPNRKAGYTLNLLETQRVIADLMSTMDEKALLGTQPDPDAPSPVECGISYEKGPCGILVYPKIRFRLDAQGKRIIKDGRALHEGYFIARPGDTEPIALCARCQDGARNYAQETGTPIEFLPYEEVLSAIKAQAN